MRGGAGRTKSGSSQYTVSATSFGNWSLDVLGSCKRYEQRPEGLDDREGSGRVSANEGCRETAQSTDAREIETANLRR